MKMATQKLMLFVAIICCLATGSFAQVAAYHPSNEVIQVPPTRTGMVIYNQLTGVSGTSALSQDVTDLPEYTSIGADDFIVPVGASWDIHFIDVAGQNQYSAGIPVSAVNVFIYADDNGIPGNVIHSFPNITSINQTALSTTIDKLEISLPSGLVLTEGHYWLAVQVIGSSTQGLWYWCEQTGLTINDEYQWKNPLDGFGMGMIDWTASSQFTMGYMNLAFAFYGQSLPHDLAMLSVEAPVTASGLGANETITVKMKNEGANTETGFNVSYTVDGGSPVTGNVGFFTLAPNEVSLYDYPATADFSTPGPHTIVASVNLASDPRPDNNTASKVIYNLGTIYPMPSIGTSTITSCGATFTDAGGLAGDFGQDDNATTTIYPATAGDRVKLTFLTFDVSWGGFSIYNGADMSAPLIGTWYSTNSPGEVVALNTSGALTIHFEGPGWETRPGWSAFISCFTPATDDFAALSMNCDNPTMFQGDNAILSANVQNWGTVSQSKTVTFKANNVVIGIQTTPVLNPGDTAWVSVPFSPVNPGNYSLVASLPADLGAQPNDTVSIQKMVYPFGTFYEEFEGNVFPPENWRQGGNWTQGTSPAVGLFNADCYVDYSSSDTLVSPRLDIHPGDMLTFAAKTTPWWVGNLDLYWLDEQTGAWNYMQTIPLSTFSYTLHTVDMSQAAGVNRIGFLVNVTDPFSWAGNVQLDNVIGQGITVHHDDHDLKIKSFTGNSFYNVNEPANFQVVVRNDGLLTAASTAYQVNLMKGGPNPVELLSIPGQTIALQQEITFDLSYTFTSIDNFPVYAEVAYAEDQYPANNKSQEIALTGVSSGSVVVPVGTDNFQVSWPIDFSYNQSLSETIYLNSEINQTGVLFGINYDYNFQLPENNVPVRIWVGETALSEITDWVPATQMTLVYDGTLNYEAGKHSIYIPFQSPFNYSDPSMNVVIMTEKIDTHYDMNQNFYAYGSLTNSSIEMSGDNSIPDPYAPTGGWPTNINPAITLVFNSNVGSLQGTVDETNGSGLADVMVLINELGISSTTDASGHYLMPYVPAGDYQVTASKFQYLPVTQPASIASNNITTVDFMLNLLDMLSVTGRVVGNNNPSTGIANATVTLSGYSNYTTTTDAQGYFTLGNVYSNNTYTIEISSPGYDNYTSPVIVGSSVVDLGDITLIETLTIPFAIAAVDQVSKVHLSWASPDASAQAVLAFDDGVNENGYAGEPNEEVWLGNYFPVTNIATVTSFDVYWAAYGLNTPQTMRLDIFDEQANLLVSSSDFTSGIDQWVNVDVPNLTLQGNYYVMIHWSGNFAQSTFLAIDTTVTNPNYARYLYPGGTPQLLSGLVNQQGTFLIHANAMVGGKKSVMEPGSTSMVSGYNIYRGLLSDIANAGSWAPLNSGTSPATIYDDTTWPSAGNGYYIYAVKALYSQGASELSFSNILLNLYTGTKPLTEPEYAVYPNPASEFVNIDYCKDTQITLFSMAGKLIYRNDIHDDHYSLDVTRFSRGMYSLVIVGKSGMAQQKLVID